MSENPVLLFDEPTSGLDAKHMKQVAELLRLLKREGRTVLVITHDTEPIREAADETAAFAQSAGPKPPGESRLQISG